MPLITIRDLTIGFRGPALLDNVSCIVDPGQRIGLLGRNGSGKTTLLRILSGEMEPDRGEVTFSPGTKVALLQQEVPQDIVGPVRDVVATGVPVGEDEHESAWRVDQQVEQILSRMELPAEAEFSKLSSGMKRRVLLARALASSPDVLLLDEPTNHLDVDAITWLETFLARSNVTLIFVTHDRMFLRKLANRILEIDRGRLFDWTCDYDTFLSRKEAALAAEEKQNALFDKRLAEEEVWIRQGIKARRTRNEGRVRALEEMRRVRSDRRDGGGKVVKMAIQNSGRSGVLVAEAKDVSFAYADRTIMHEFSTTILRGDKIGIIGRNGAGKTTLLRVLLGQLQPQSGSVRLGTNLQIAYFDQLRHQLNEELSVQENVADGYDTVMINGQPRHIISYLQDFLFSAERARTLVRFLSGGERNRVLLAKLFAKPANVVVLDEPTNDLDAETLEMLEERLVQFEGTVLLVSHDRMFLNNVVAATLVFEADGVKEYVGGYDDWLRQRPAPVVETPVKVPAPAATSSAKSAKESDNRKRRLTFKENQELQGLVPTIDRLEREIESLHRDMASPEFYQQSGDKIAQGQAKLKELEQQLATSFARWEELAQFAE
jgi:ATP-binding cassette subfamily F protein uup